MLVVFVFVKNLILHANSYKDPSYYKVSGCASMGFVDLGCFFLLEVINLFSSLHAFPSMSFHVSSYLYTAQKSLFIVKDF